MTIKAIRASRAAIAGLLCVWSGAALADVKSGVDAWVAGDYAAAVREWAQPAASGDADAQFNMAQAYRLGRGVQQDMQQAEALYARASAQGHTRAADNYGLMLFQEGRRAQAMPYLEAAARRGDPRGQYLVGIAHFNGDLVAKDWRRAYALMVLANGAALPQAKAALAQMEEFIAPDDRAAGLALASILRTQAEQARQQENAAAGFITADDTPAKPAKASKPLAPAPVVAAAAPVAKAAASRPATAQVATPAATGGEWKVQLGAFGVADNAEKLWAQLAANPALKGAAKVKRPSGKVTVLLAGGFASQADAAKACGALKSAGHSCLATR